MHLYYSPEASESTFALPAGESRHCMKVMRMSPGDMINVTNGKGLIFNCRLVAGEAKMILAQAIGQPTRIQASNVHLQIAISPTKNINRIEWFVEKATEIGVTTIIPLICFHSERRKLNKDRLSRVAIAAMKQSKSAWLPEIADPLDFQSLVNQDFPGEKFIASLSNDALPLATQAIRQKGCSLLIGPEGDFSKFELEEAIRQGYKPVHLGAKRLRTETAGVVACTIVNLLQNRIG